MVFRLGCVNRVMGNEEETLFWSGRSLNGRQFIAQRGKLKVLKLRKVEIVHGILGGEWSYANEK